MNNSRQSNFRKFDHLLDGFDHLPEQRDKAHRLFSLINASSPE
jgi:hypothetical protein